jgi:hypothetical protein
MSGTVRDPQDRPIPDGKIQIQHVKTGLTRSTVSNSAGVFFLNGSALGGTPSPRGRKDSEKLDSRTFAWRLGKRKSST